MRRRLSRVPRWTRLLAVAAVGVAFAVASVVSRLSDQLSPDDVADALIEEVGGSEGFNERPCVRTFNDRSLLRCEVSDLSFSGSAEYAVRLDGYCSTARRLSPPDTVEGPPFPARAEGCVGWWDRLR